ncbi:MAG TPA: mechanosensitive ion channel domain-containing protein [Flavisolibacter sp.]|jgi:MscS family membrane protein|nr:mechanosensitive ion channel domain-containing protein [Flavisolibacter sp.]
MNRIIWGNTIESYLWTFGVILFVLLLNRFISKHFARLVFRFFPKRLKTYDPQKFTDLIVYPLGTFLIITVSIVAFYRLNYPPNLTFTLYKYTLHDVLLSLAIAVQVLAFTWLILRIIDFIASILEKKADETPTPGDNQLIVFFRDFIKVIIAAIGILLMLNQAFGYDISSLLTGLSIVGAALALAFRESLENLIASFVIFFDRPFQAGDFVKVQSVAGVVERVGLRSTRVRTADKSYVTVPNKQMVDSILDNVSKRSQIRGTIDLHLHLQTPTAKINELLTEVKSFLSTIPEIQTQTVLFNEIRLQAYVVFIEFFTPPIPWPEFTAIKQRINFHVLQTMDKLQIKIAAEGKDLAFPIGNSQ